MLKVIEKEYPMEDFDKFGLMLIFMLDKVMDALLGVVFWLSDLRWDIWDRMMSTPAEVMN